MITETFVQSLSREVLEKHGFRKRWVASRHQQEHTGYPPHILMREGVYMFRLHVLQWLIYDTNDGFVTIMQKHEPAKYISGTEKSIESEMRDYITIPKPIRTEEDLVLLLSAITNGFS